MGGPNGSFKPDRVLSIIGAITGVIALSLSWQAYQIATRQASAHISVDLLTQPFRFLGRYSPPLPFGVSAVYGSLDRQIRLSRKNAACLRPL